MALGVIGRRKGTDVLLNALAGLTARGIAWRAVIGGDGDVAAAREQARTLGIDGQVAFPGWLDEAGADDALRSADIFVLPSRAENQPVSILEAMARGLPVVATSVGAIPDQVSAEKTGLLVAPEDVDALTDALAMLIAAPDLRHEYGEAGRQRFVALFSLEACAERFVRLYRALA